MRSGRLALYLWAAEQAKGEWITSQQISEAIGVNSTAVRRDLSHLRLRGRRGLGYLASELVEALRPVLEPYQDVLEALAEWHRVRHEQIAKVAAGIAATADRRRPHG